MNPTERNPLRRFEEGPRKKVTVLPDPIPASESEREEEAALLLASLEPDEEKLLTTWELQTIGDIKNGLAVTRIRLKELRDTVKRIHKR